MKVYILLCFSAIVVTCSADLSSIENENGQNRPNYLYNDYASVGREGNSNYLNRYSLRERNSNLLESRISNILQNNLLREGNSYDWDLSNSDNSNLLPNNNNLIENNLLNIRREGISKNQLLEYENTRNNLLRYNNLLKERSSSNLNLRDSKNNYLSPNNLLNVAREENPNNLYLVPSEVLKAGREEIPGPLNPLNVYLQTAALKNLGSSGDPVKAVKVTPGNTFDPVNPNDLGKPVESKNFATAVTLPPPNVNATETESRFGHRGYPPHGGYGGGGYAGAGAGAGGGVSAGLSAGIGISAGIGGHIGAGAGAHGYGYGGGGYGYPGYG